MGRTALEESSIGELVSRLAEETSALVRDELRVAQLEMTRKGRYAGLGAGLVGAAGLVAGLALACLVAAAVLGLATALPGWLSALLVGAVLLVGAAALALVGKREIAEALPPVPEEAIAGVRLDLEALKP
ncbi:MAG TPA: phage holin family protein [Mycobacteriales bacterium]|nr:phage holin family protein [Mycobacteriales bacterium]